jgi:hypothetical protein
MKSLIAVAALVAFAVVSVSANAASPKSSDLVIVNGKVVGQDPDANIRGALTKDPYVVD